MRVDCLALRSAGLALVLAATAATAAAADAGDRIFLTTPSGISVSLLPSDGSFTLSVDGTTWLETAKGGPARVYDRGTV